MPGAPPENGAPGLCPPATDMCDDFSQPRLKAADLEKLAKERLAELQGQGEELHPVVSRSRKLASHFWGSSWMRHLARCESGGLCLAPGRSLLRHGCVLDLKLAPGLICAKVSAEEIYDVRLEIAPLDGERTAALADSCRGHIGSLVSLLEGKLDSAVLERLCDADSGLLPEPADWRMGCTCPDWAEPCPHAAAAVYAAGVMIDADPALLFSLRAVDPALLLQGNLAEPAAFDADALASTFGIDIDTTL